MRQHNFLICLLTGLVFHLLSDLFLWLLTQACHFPYWTMATFHCQLQACLLTRIAIFSETVIASGAPAPLPHDWWEIKRIVETDDTFSVLPGFSIKQLCRGLGFQYVNKFWCNTPETQSHQTSNLICRYLSYLKDSN